ncbi:MAG: hypothetical protein EHM43_13215 [Ignavibacteriae bacterium]|nr:MAG: hypothetical protein EHM43_13215 [Ignavibacteriota bacterium]
MLGHEYHGFNGSPLGCPVTGCSRFANHAFDHWFGCSDCWETPCTCAQRVDDPVYEGHTSRNDIIAMNPTDDGLVESTAEADLAWVEMWNGYRMNGYLNYILTYEEDMIVHHTVYGLGRIIEIDIHDPLLGLKIEFHIEHKDFDLGNIMWVTPMNVAPALHVIMENL